MNIQYAHLLSILLIHFQNAYNFFTHQLNLDFLFKVGITNNYSKNQVILN